MSLSPTVLWVHSANFSGSTLLGAMFGSHSRAVFLGELQHLFKPPRSRKSRTRCHRCRDCPCPVLDDLRAVGHRLLYPTLFQRCRSLLLVDSSKKPDWTRRFLWMPGFRKRSVFLVRDPRGYCCSRMLRRPDMPLSTWLTNWVRTNTRIWRFLQHHRHLLPHVLLTYYELATAPEICMEQLCHWLGLGYEPSMVTYWNREHHALAGNGTVSFYSAHYSTPDPEFYRRRWRQRFVDLRWKELLPRHIQYGIIRDPRVRVLLDQLGLRFSPDGLIPRTRTPTLASDYAGVSAALQLG